MKRTRPFVLPARRPSDARPAAPRANGPAGRAIGPADIVIVNGDSVQVCHMDVANAPLLGGVAALSLCHDSAPDDATRPVDDLCVTRVGEVLMLRVA